MSYSECDAIDAVCTESLTTLMVTWQPFSDPESGIASYQVAVGTSPGGGQVRSFFEIPQGVKFYAIEGLNLMGYRLVSS